ncbi:hypothetical protein RhiJN_10514 [Ceratobasidium sp. AG-Ba]|nr:hypothetical protein RhiJN_10514 [Ceratobasidium sp. AG-Ba]
MSWSMVIGSRTKLDWIETGLGIQAATMIMTLAINTWTSLLDDPSQQDQVVDVSRCDYGARVCNWHPANPETQSKMCEPTSRENRLGVPTNTCFQPTPTFHIS